MEKTSDKLLKWTKKDWALNVLVYFANFVVLALTFVLGVYVQCQTNTALDFSKFSQNSVKFFNLIILLFFMSVGIFLFFYFEDRDFLKNSVNSEMIFFVI